MKIAKWLGFLWLLGALLGSGGCIGAFKVTTSSNGAQRKELCFGWRTDGNNATSTTEVGLSVERPKKVALAKDDEADDGT